MGGKLDLLSIRRGYENRPKAGVAKRSLRPFLFVRRFLVKAIARTRIFTSYKLRICIFFKMLK